MNIFLHNLSIVGLILDIVGAGLIWKFGVTAYLNDPKLHAAIEASIWDDTYDSHLDNYRIRIQITQRWSNIGLLMLLTGFVLQLFGNIQSQIQINNLSTNLYSVQRQLTEHKAIESTKK